MFAPKSIELGGDFILSAPPDKVFGFFSPLGEKLWVPGWNPELLYPPEAEWERGQIFRTQEERGAAIWVISALDRQRHQVEYHRVEAGRYVARVSVRCKQSGAGNSEVEVTYTFIGLSDAGNRDIAEMSATAYREKMERWRGWIEQHLANTAR